MFKQLTRALLDIADAIRFVGAELYVIRLHLRRQEYYKKYELNIISMETLNRELARLSKRQDQFVHSETQDA